MPSKKKTQPPWKKDSPNSNSQKLTPQAKSAAKKRAKRAGRKYPNLVDNMHAAVAQKKKDKRSGE